MKIPHYDEILLLTKLEEPLSENDNSLAFRIERFKIKKQEENTLNSAYLIKF